MALEPEVSASPGDLLKFRFLGPSAALLTQSIDVFRQVPQVILKQLELEKHLEREWTNLFCKKLDTKYIQLYGPCSYSSAFEAQNSHRQYENE